MKLKDLVKGLKCTWSWRRYGCRNQGYCLWFQKSKSRFSLCL